MARMRSRTDYLPQVIIQQILTLFGTISNAHVRLGMHPMSMATFHAALSGYPITVETSDVIERRWYQWCKEFKFQALTELSPVVPFTLEGNPWATDATDLHD